MTLHELAAAIAKARAWALQADGSRARLTVLLKDGRFQDVAVSEFQDGADPCARFTSVVGNAEILDARRMRSALELNVRLPHGCLAIENGELVMTDTLPLNSTTVETSGRAAEFLAAQADRYERLIYGGDAH